MVGDSAARPASLTAEIQQVLAALPNKPMLFLVVVAWVVLFHYLGNSTFGYRDTPSLFGWLQYSYQNPEDGQHGYLMPFVVLLLLWLRRSEILAKGLGAYWPAIFLIVLGLLAHMTGFVIQQTRLSLVGFIIGLYGITGLYWGAQWLRSAFFPFAFFAFCVPLGSASEFITFPLRILTTKLAVGFCNLFLGMEVVRDGTLIFSPDLSFQYDVAPACSGIRSLYTMVALAAIYGSMVFRHWWQRLGMVILAMPLAVIGNTARIITTTIVGETVSQEAGAWIEQKLGFITFAVALALAIAAARGLRWMETRWYGTKEGLAHV